MFSVTLNEGHLSRWFSGKESNCQCRRCGFYLWVGKTPWRRKCHPILVFLPGKSHEQRSLVGYSPWGSRSVRYDLETEHEHDILFIHSFIDVHLRLFHNVANENNADMNMSVHISLQGSSFSCLGCISRNVVVAHMVILFLIFGRTIILHMLSCA